MITEHQILKIKKYCREPIENIKGYKEALISSEKYHCHHINELTFTRSELIKMNMYYSRPASELILLTASEHAKLHCRHNMPSARTGSKHGMYGRTGNKSPMYGVTGDKHPMYGRTGDKNPLWKGDDATDHAKYVRQYREQNRQKYRDHLRQWRAKRRATSALAP